MSARRQFGIALVAMAASCTVLSCTGSHPASPAGHAHAQAARQMPR
jgi:hypothetical protein